MSVSALVLAGGSGERLESFPKAFLTAGGETLLERVVRQLTPLVDDVVVGLPADRVDEGRELVGASARVFRGGVTRQATIETLLDQATGDFILVHDVARPLASNELFERVIETAKLDGAAAAALWSVVRDSMALADGDILGEPLDRAQIVSVQTPCVFSRSLLEKALAQADDEGWVDTGIATLVARAGGLVRLVEGEESNLKITYPEDWEIIQQQLT